MIFFIISKKRRGSKDWKELKAGSPGAPLKYTDGGWVIIAWNEVFTDLNELRQCVFTVAREDPVCLDIRAQALARFGIDPFLDECTGGNVDKPTMEKLVATTFQFWAHPYIGNITQSPKLRPSPVGPEPLLNWSSSDLLDTTTQDAIKVLAQTLGPIGRSRRDQVRICTNVTELARAIIGEIACTASRRLEKLFALRLCHSPGLLKQQQWLLSAMIDEPQKWMAKILQSHQENFPWPKCEYTKYYLGMPARNDQWPLFATLLNDATGGKYPKAKGTLSGDAQTSFNTWKMLPTTIRCAILMNDLRKLAPLTEEDHRRTSMCMLEDKLPLERGKDPAYTVGDSATKVLSEIKSRPWSFAWSWNRDEYAIPTKTYRHFLCPLWAGASGHTNGALTFWAKATGVEKLNAPQMAAVATGLFTVWRLYYDKRISANHTLAETFEATGALLGTNKPQLALPDKIPTVGPADDAFGLIESCWKLRTFADPILILRAIGASYLLPGKSFAEQFTALDGDIDKERTQLSIQFTVPVWSWALDAKQGLATTSFAEKYVTTPSPLATVALVTKPSDTAVKALGTLTKKEGGDKTDKDDD